MSEIQNTDELVTKSELSQFYQAIYPYLNGAAHAGFTPVGTVISVMGVSAPANYLICNGQIVNIADYKELADYFEAQFGAANHFGGDGTTTFAVPDLRGTGTNSHANQGNGAAVGVHQDATASPVISAAKDGTSLLVRANDALTATGVTNADATYKRNTSGTLKNALATTTASTTGETYDSICFRPTNTSVLYCIATKNIYIDARFDYSTEEKVVGTWIDGKPLYQKTITGTLSSKLETNKTVDTLGFSVDHCSFLCAEIYAQGDTTIEDASNDSVRLWINKATGNVFTRVVNDRSSILGWNISVTFQYTKTTDTAS